MDYLEFKRLTAHCGGAFLPVLGDVVVYDNDAGERRAQVGNGRYWVDVPTDLPVMQVNSDKMVAALGACRSGTPQIRTTDKSVIVSAGTVRARVALHDTAYPLASPDAPDETDLHGVTALLKALSPFVADDASRPWATSICLSGGHGYCTNNVILARIPLPFTVDPPVNIPGAVVEAIVERGDAVRFGHTDKSVTVYYADGSWVRTLLIVGDWPTGVVDSMLANSDHASYTTPDPMLVELMLTAAKLCDERNPIVQFSGGGLGLTDGTFIAETVNGVTDRGKVSARMAAIVFSHANEIAWHTPREDAHTFRGANGLCGVFGGSR